MKRKLKKIEQHWNKGENLYDSFCGMFKGFKVTTPRTSTLELFALLKDRNENELLLREMMKEFVSNIDDVSVFAEKGKLYKNVVYREKF
jgi:hypothetical protein